MQHIAQGPGLSRSSGRNWTYGSAAFFRTLCCIFRSRSCSDFKVYIYSLGLQTLKKQYSNISSTKWSARNQIISGNRVLARILDLGRVSNDQGVHMSITLNSKITVLVMLANNNACGCSMLWNQIQGEHTLILRTEIKILSYFSNSWGYLKPF